MPLCISHTENVKPYTSDTLVGMVPVLYHRPIMIATSCLAFIYGVPALRDAGLETYADNDQTAPARSSKDHAVARRDTACAVNRWLFTCRARFHPEISGGKTLQNC